jgi:hypothetical protein
VFPQNSPPTQFTSKQDSWHQTTNSNKQHQRKRHTKKKNTSERKRKQVPVMSASD